MEEIVWIIIIARRTDGPDEGSAGRPGGGLGAVVTEESGYEA